MLLQNSHEEFVANAHQSSTYFDRSKISFLHMFSVKVFVINTYLQNSSLYLLYDSPKIGELLVHRFPQNHTFCYRVTNAEYAVQCLRRSIRARYT